MRIMIAGNYGADNIGDEMILHGLLDEIKYVSPEAEIVILSGTPENTEKVYGLTSKAKFPSGVRSFFKMIFQKKFETYQYLKKTDLFILGGGGLFSNLKKVSYYIWGIQAFMAYFQKKPVLMLGQSLDKPESFISRIIVHCLFKRACLIAVRDKESKKVLRNVRVHKDIHHLPDLAFHSSLKSNNHNTRKELVVALRQMDNLKPSFKENIAAFLDYLIKKFDWNIHFVNFQNGENDSDGIIHCEIMEMMENKKRVAYTAKLENPLELLDILSEAKMVLGMRLHSVIAAIKTETPFIAINYAPKVRAFLKSNSLDQNVLEMNDIGLAKLQYQYGVVNEKYQLIEDRLKKFNQVARDRLTEFDEKVFKPLLHNLK